MLHPFHGLLSYSAAVALGVLTVGSAPLRIAVGTHDVKRATESAVAPHTPAVQPSVKQEPAAECPAYAAALKSSGRQLVIVTSPGCVPCAALKTELKLRRVPFVEVNTAEHPLTSAGFNAKLFPSWYVIQDGKVIESGVGNVGAAYLKGRL